ncbi:hypothetical protein IRZ70_04565 [Pseudomonas monteilii]|nr:hypothetical protein [Pseudomonas monteilii]
MLKIVPDPPYPTELAHSLEDILMQTSEYLVCALSIVQQNTLTHQASSAQALTLATMHEIEAARGMVKMALSKVQVRH